MKAIGFTIIFLAVLFFGVFLLAKSSWAATSMAITKNDKFR